mmetsp:Transcript_25722/g.70882  ORF Transcript_25722/g.70882 Transcript_25722/m.70882 type:complete len:80 (-) Transcript_25722:20-259(-)
MNYEMAPQPAIGVVAAVAAVVHSFQFLPSLWFGTPPHQDNRQQQRQRIAHPKGSGEGRGNGSAGYSYSSPQQQTELRKI